MNRALDYVFAFIAALMLHAGGFFTLGQVAEQRMITREPLPSVPLEQSVLQVHLLKNPERQAEDDASEIVTKLPVMDENSIQSTPTEPQEIPVATSAGPETEEVLPAEDSIVQAPEQAEREVPPVQNSTPVATSCTPAAGFSNAYIKPQLIGRLQPVYPLGSRLRGEEGTVKMRFQVTSTGKVGAVEVVSSSGYEALDRAALKAVQRARFNPALQDDKPVIGTLVITIRFQLTE